MTNQNFPYPDTFVIVNRFRMHYYHSGTDDPVNVVMLHGSRSTAHAYRRLFPHLIAAGFRCFAPNAIGFGQSDQPHDPSIHTFDFHSDNLETFIRELDLRNIILVGHEWGGLIAIDYAINRPDNTLALVLTDSGVFLPNRKSGLRGLLDRSILGNLLFRRSNAKPAHPQSRRPSVDRQPTPESSATRRGFIHMAAQAHHGYNRLRMNVIRNSLPRLQTPTLLIRSRSPQLFSEDESLFLQQQLTYVRSVSLPISAPLEYDNLAIDIESILNFLAPIASLTTPIPST